MSKWYDRNFNGTIENGKLFDHDEDFSEWIEQVIRENEGSKCMASVTMTLVDEK